MPAVGMPGANIGYIPDKRRIGMMVPNQPAPTAPNQQEGGDPMTPQALAQPRVDAAKANMEGAAPTPPPPPPVSQTPTVADRMKGKMMPASNVPADQQSPEVQEILKRGAPPPAAASPPAAPQSQAIGYIPDKRPIGAMVPNEKLPGNLIGYEDSMGRTYQQAQRDKYLEDQKEKDLSRALMAMRNSLPPMPMEMMNQQDAEGNNRLVANPAYSEYMRASANLGAPALDFSQKNWAQGQSSDTQKMLALQELAQKHNEHGASLQNAIDLEKMRNAGMLSQGELHNKGLLDQEHLRQYGEKSKLPASLITAKIAAGGSPDVDEATDIMRMINKVSDTARNERTGPVQPTPAATIPGPATANTPIAAPPSGVSNNSIPKTNQKPPEDDKGPEKRTAAKRKIQDVLSLMYPRKPGDVGDVTTTHGQSPNIAGLMQSLRENKDMDPAQLAQELAKLSGSGGVKELVNQIAPHAIRYYNESKNPVLAATPGLDYSQKWGYLGTDHYINHPGGKHKLPTSFADSALGRGLGGAFVDPYQDLFPTTKTDTMEEYTEKAKRSGALVKALLAIDSKK